jgi:uncharacterized protein
MQARNVWAALTAAIVIVFACGFASMGQAADPIKVVYHVTDTEGQARLALGNIRNHLRADPTAKITVVALYKGINFMLEGATDANGNPYALNVEELAAKGVEFKVCKNSLDFFKVDPAKVLPEAKIVPSGVAEVARLQAQEGYAYIKP